MNRHVSLFIALFAVVLVVTDAYAAPACPSLRVAVNVPLTGALATYGTAVREGVSFAEEESPSKVTYSWEDNRSDPKEAVTVFRKQETTGFDVYVSGVKPQYMAIQGSLSRYGAPHFAWVFDTQLRTLPNEPTFRTWVNFKIEPPLFIEYARKQNAKRVAIVYVDLPTAVEEYEEHVIPGLKASGIQTILTERYQMDERNFQPIVLKLRGFRPDLVILCGFQENFVSLIPALRTQQIVKDGNTLASYDLLDAAPLLPSHMLEGIRVSTPQFLLRPNQPPVAEWITRFRTRFGKEPLYTHAYAYDMAAILRHAAETRSEPCTKEDVPRVLESTDLPGITGRLKFDGQGDLEPSVGIGVYRGGRLFPATD